MRGGVRSGAVRQPSDRHSGALLLSALALLVVPPVNASCSKACGEVGCQSQLTAVVSASIASLPAGTHRIDVTADGAMSSCTFTFPLETAPGGGLVGPQCSPGLIGFVGPAQQCTPFTTGDAKGLRCVPLPDQVQESIQIVGTPSMVAVEQSVGGVVILQRSATPAYADNQPNGPGCEPTCRQATAEWSIP